MPATSRSVLPSGKSLIFVFPVVALLQWAPLSALEPPSKAFLDKNSFYLSSAGFKAHFANDAASKKAMHALPAHRFVIHRINGDDVRYLYAEPLHCVCVFIGTKDAYQSYRDMLSQPIQQPDNVRADYQSQVSSVLVGDPVDIGGLPSLCRRVFPQLLLRSACGRGAKAREGGFFLGSDAWISVIKGQVCSLRS